MCRPDAFDRIKCGLYMKVLSDPGNLLGSIIGNCDQTRIKGVSGHDLLIGKRTHRFCSTFPQDDIQIIINQQLRSQQQLELPQKKPTSNSMSFFRKPNKMSSPWTHQLSPPSTWNLDTNPDKAQFLWRDWLRRGKGTQYGK